MKIRLRPELRTVSEISARIEEGYAAAQRGELINSEEARSSLSQRKRERFGGPHQG